MPEAGALWRVLPYLRGARPEKPGHPLFVPNRQGAGRVDNPEHYLTLYAADSPEGAVAEAFGDLAQWTTGMLRGSPSLPGSIRALAEITTTTPLAVCDLDDAKQLVSLHLRPSQVVTRDRRTTQGWALRIHSTGSYAGVRWWSYRDPSWGSIALWHRAGLSVASVEPLTVDHPAVLGAAEVLNRPLRD